MIRAELETELARVGTESVNCGKKCKGVENSIEEGICPRSVMISGQSRKIACVIVSLAPPRTTARERKSLAGARDFKDILQQYRGKIESSAFYTKLNTIRSKLGLEGAAVWTALCKCERIKGEKLPSETVKECVESHLVKELELVDRSVPIIAVGNRAFTAIRQSFPERFVLNVPSPDGMRGDFQETVDNQRLLEFAKARMAEDKPGSLCLCPPCARRYLMSD